MKMKPSFAKDSKPIVWLILVAMLYSAEIKLALCAEIPATIPEGLSEAGISVPSNPLINSENIPADNPIGAILLSKQNLLLSRPNFSRVSDFVSQIYQNTSFQPIWFTANRSEKNLTDLLTILNSAPNNALNSANYDINQIKEWQSSQNLDAKTLANYDVAVTIALVRFLHDLRQGQVEPRDIQYPIHIAPKPPLDIANLLKQSLATETLPDLVGQFEPKTKQYQKLKQILNRLQDLRNQINASEVKLNKPASIPTQLAKTRISLQTLGVLNENKTDLTALVKKIQKQPGGKANASLSASTATLLDQACQENMAQIELAMERARWIPDTTDGPMILVNIPAFELWAFNSADDPKPLNMKVIVGKSPDNQTPVLWEEMKYLEFMPYWNIPKSIYEKEIWPKVQNNSAYLAAQDIELVRHQIGDGSSYIRARQRPGKKNPLGRVKFVFPNTADVYLHDTPGHAAFNRPRRDLSHGCVRVSEPEQLAEFVLGNQEGWDKESIRQAMSAPKTRHVALKRSVPVLFYYATTFVSHDNQIRFYPDIYGQDELLKKALNKLQTSNSTTLVSSATSNNQ